MNFTRPTLVAPPLAPQCEGWELRVVPTDLTFTVVARRGAQVLRSEKLTADDVRNYDADARWAHALMLGRSKRGL